MSLAAIDGEVNPKEKDLLDRFARKLDITDVEYAEVLSSNNKYPINPPNTSEERLERLFDLFRIVYADHEIEEEEMILINKYAIGLGYSSEAASKLIKRSIQIFGGRLDFDDYVYLVKK